MKQCTVSPANHAIGLNLMAPTYRKIELLAFLSGLKLSGTLKHCLFMLMVVTIASVSSQLVHASECETTDNLLADADFSTVGSKEKIWRYLQHTGEVSFDFSSEEGVLEITRTARQPWMLLKQQLKNPEFAGATIRFTADLKGELPTSPQIHAFEHKAGLYIKLGKSRAELAPHEPNKETFDWQSVSLERTLPPGVTKIEVGFVHQAGGTLWTRSPELVIVNCSG